jgi:Fe-S-cluster containining protein
VIDADEGALDFFMSMHQQFKHVIQEHRGKETMLAALLTRAFVSYEGNAALQSGEQPEPDCRKGCATCCSIRVVATAPEVLLVARYVRAMETQLNEQGVDVRKRLAAADKVTRGCGEQERVALRRRCPFIHKGVCMIYPARPLACRSHISYDKQACVDAAAGRVDAVPYSVPHMHVRSLVQNALQSALRDADYPWVAYEMNQAVSIALMDDRAEADWLAGGDLFAPAMVDDVTMADMEATYDRLHGRIH